MNQLRHIGIIMDGNGRWAQKNGLPRSVGHLKGLKSLKNVVLGAVKHNIPYLTLYCFSTENWTRPSEEVNYLMGLFSEKLYGEIDFFQKNNIKLIVLGKYNELSKVIQEKVIRTETETKDNTGMTLQLAINYGGQQEICDAVNKAIKCGEKELTPELLRSYFYHPEVPPVDLILRTAGEYRISNFLLFDSAYAEFLFIDEFWPDCDEKLIEKIIIDYNNRVRRFGGVV